MGLTIKFLYFFVERMKGMRKKIVRVGKRVTAVALAAVMTVSGVQYVNSTTAEAAGTPAARTDDSIIYAVDCGDVDPSTAPSDGPLGTHNSVTDQVYQADPQTGYKWGIDDTVSSPLANGSSSALANAVFTDHTWPFESVTTDQSSKESTNRYTKNQYEKKGGWTSDSRNLNYKFEIENGSYMVEIGFADPWGCSKTPTVYVNKGKADETLLEKDYSASNGALIKNVDITTGELAINLESDRSDTLAINATYITISQKDDKKIVEKDMAALSVDSEVTSDISLPTKGTIGGSTIKWESSNESVISTKGEVKRPEKGGDDVTVTLKATVSYGSAAVSKEFTVTVLAQSELSNLKSFELDEVNVLDDYYNNVTEKDVAFLNTFDPDRLLYNFRRTAGYTTDEVKKMDFHGTGTGASKAYSGWESRQIGGHTLGHYLAAAAQGVKNGYGDSKGSDGKTLAERLDYLISALKDCQEKDGTGYIFGASDTVNSYKQFDALEGKATYSNWVPWYTMHKIVNGLVETYKFTDNKDALTVAEGLAEWIYNRTSQWSPSIQAGVLNVEYGGMNDCLYELYTCAKKTGYDDTKLSHIATAAHMFDEDSLFKQVLAGNSNVLNGRHANCTIPKFIGALNRYRTLKDEGVSGIDKYLEYAKAFWSLVVNHHTYITGGNSECEFFGADDVLDKERSNCNCETCNTHNMLKLSKWLYELTGDKLYADYYETTFINAIMASINEETGMTTYFQPMATGLWKVYCNSDVEKNYFWCCTGTGLENFTKLGEGFYYSQGDDLVVNQYISSDVTFGNVKLTQNSKIPDSDTTKLTVNLLNGKSSADMKIYLRVPDWVAGSPVIKVNGTKIDYKKSSGYIAIDRTWKNGDTVDVQLPMEIRAYSLPDNEGKVFGFKYGPIVLAAQLTTGDDSKMTTHQIGVQCDVADYKIVNGKEMKLPGSYGGTSNLATLSTETLNVLNSSVSEYIGNINKYLVKDANSLKFTLKGTDYDGTLNFVPYYRIHSGRYGIYWLFSEDASADASKQILSEKEAGRDNRVYLSGVGVGYTIQTEGSKADSLYPEMDETNSEQNEGKTGRYAKAGGSFSYLFKVDKNNKTYLVCKFAKEDNGKPITIKAAGVTIAEVAALNYSGDDEFYTVEYEIPSSALAKAESYTYKDSDGNYIDTRDVLRIEFSGTASKASATVYSEAYTKVAYSTNADISELSYKAGSTSGKATKSGSNFTITVPKATTSIDFTAKLADAFGLLYVDEKLVDDSKEQTVKLSGDKTTVKLVAYAEDHETAKEFTLTVAKETDATNTNTNTNANTTTEDKTDNTVAATGVTVKIKNYPMLGSKIVLKKGKKITLKAAVTPSTASQKVTYKSSKTKVAAVSAKGVVTAKKAGTAKITIKADNGKKKVVTIKVVKKNKVNKKLTLKKTKVTVKKGKTYSIAIKKMTANATSKITYKSKKASVAKVDGYGLITGKKKGTTKITVKCGKAKKTITVKVK